MVKKSKKYFREIQKKTLALLGQSLKKSPIGQKLDFANHPYLCKGLIKPLKRSPSFLDLILFMQRSLYIRNF
jgi:hypothetical protein